MTDLFANVDDQFEALSSSSTHDNFDYSAIPEGTSIMSCVVASIPVDRRPLFKNLLGMMSEMSGAEVREFVGILAGIVPPTQALMGKATDEGTHAMELSSATFRRAYVADTYCRPSVELGPRGLLAASVKHADSVSFKGGMVECCLDSHTCGIEVTYPNHTLVMKVQASHGFLIALSRKMRAAVTFTADASWLVGSAVLSSLNISVGNTFVCKVDSVTTARSMCHVEIATNVEAIASALNHLEVQIRPYYHYAPAETITLQLKKYQPMLYESIRKTVETGLEAALVNAAKHIASSVTDKTLAAALLLVRTGAQKMAMEHSKYCDVRATYHAYSKRGLNPCNLLSVDPQLWKLSWLADKGVKRLPPKCNPGATIEGIVGTGYGDGYCHYIDQFTLGQASLYDFLSNIPEPEGDLFVTMYPWKAFVDGKIPEIIWTKFLATLSQNYFEVYTYPDPYDPMVLFKIVPGKPGKPMAKEHVLALLFRPILRSTAMMTASIELCAGGRGAITLGQVFMGPKDGHYNAVSRLTHVPIPSATSMISVDEEAQMLEQATNPTVVTSRQRSTKRNYEGDVKSLDHAVSNVVRIPTEMETKKRSSERRPVKKKRTPSRPVETTTTATTSVAAHEVVDYSPRSPNIGQNN